MEIEITPVPTLIGDGQGPSSSVGVSTEAVVGSVARTDSLKIVDAGIVVIDGADQNKVEISSATNEGDSNNNSSDVLPIDTLQTDENLVTNSAGTAQTRRDHILKMASNLTTQNADGKDCVLLSALSGQIELYEFVKQIISDSKVIQLVVSEEVRVEEERRVECERMESVAEVEAVEMQKREYESAMSQSVSGSTAVAVTTTVSTSVKVTTAVPVGVAVEGSGGTDTLTESKTSTTYIPDDKVQGLRQIEGALENIWCDAKINSVSEEGTVSVEYSDGVVEVVAVGEVVRKIRRIQPQPQRHTNENESLPSAIDENLEFEVEKKAETQKMAVGDEKDEKKIRSNSMPKIIDPRIKIIERQKVVWRDEDVTHALELVKNDDLKCLIELFDLNYDGERVLSDGVTLGMMAAKLGHIKILNYLLDKNINFSVRDIENKSVMHYAAMCYKEDVIAFLLTHAKTKICKCFSPTTKKKTFRLHF